MRRFHHKLSLCIVLIAAAHLSACSTFGGEDSSAQKQTGVDTLTPADWLAVNAAELPSTDWVITLGDELLLELIDEALDKNTDVRSARARWDAARANRVIARADLFPDVTLSGRASRREIDDDPNGPNRSFSIGPGVSWEADVWGRVRDTASASGMEMEATLADYAAVRLSIAGAVAQAWYDLIEARLLVNLAERDVQTQEKALSLTERRFSGGVTGSSDVRLARSSLASAEATLASRKQLRDAAARGLEVLLRRYPASELEARPDLPEVPTLGGVGQPMDIFSRRPDMVAAEYRLGASGLRVDIARKNMLPRLTLAADGTFSAASSSDLFDTDTLVKTLVGNLTAPIFRSGALRADVRRNEALLRLEVENYVDRALNAFLEVENALDAERRLAERESALRRSLREASAAEERIAQRYSEGLATILELLDAQSRAIAAESQLISARRQRLGNRVRLQLAIGGGELEAAQIPPDQLS